MPIVSAIGAAVAAVSSWTITLGTLGTFAVGNFLIRSVVQVGLSALMVKAMGKPKTAPFSIQSQVRSGGIVPRSFIMGRTGTAGSLVWHSEWGKAGKTPNAYYTRVIALSDLPIAGLAKVFVGGVPVTLGPETSEWGHPVAEYHRKDKDHLWIKFYDGTQTVADPFLVNTVGPQAAVPYEASRRGEGVAYAIVTSRIDEKLFTGFPEAFFVLDGVPLYDPSRDSSVGGSGTHRYNDPTTWGGDGDHYPAVQAYNINRGISYKGQWFYGLQSVAAARLPAANWIAQIEKCRIQVEGADGLEPSFRSGGEILVDTEIGKTQEEILACCSGRMSERGGTFKILVGAPDPAVATITDGDILDTAPQGQDPFQSLSETMNGLIATYPNPDEAFKSRQAPPVFRPDLEAEDGGRRLMGRVSLN
ncbi:MAG: phage tail protein, partial [Pseudomonadota bacterium]|nr:phage tail protein [Pseudomonadota bacterium]